MDVEKRVLQGRLQKLAENELPESQCGFKRGRGCADMVRQLMEKTGEHTAKLFVTFIDLKKAYDSVHRHALWLALRKLGVPELTIQLLAEFNNAAGHSTRLVVIRLAQ